MPLILDIGAADGATIGYRLHEMGRCVGLDLSHSLIHRAKGQGIPNADFLVASAQDLPLADNVFDMVVSEHVIEHVEDLDASLNEMGRVLKPGGTLSLSFPGERAERIIAKSCPEYFSPRFHRRVIQVSSLRQTLEKMGFQVRSVSCNQSFRALKNIYKFLAGHKIEDQTGSVRDKSLVLAVLEGMWVVLEFGHAKTVWNLKKRGMLWLFPLIYLCKVAALPLMLLFFMLNPVIPANVDVIAVKKA